MAWFLAMAKKALLQAKSITAITSQQTVSPDNGYDGLSSVTVNPQEHSATYTANTKNAALDMGAQHNNRYVNTSNIPNSNSSTYTFASGDTGGTKDMGETNSYRYVNAANVYAKGKADGKTEGTSYLSDARLYWPSAYGALTVASKQGKKFIAITYDASTPTLYQNDVALTGTSIAISTPDKINYGGGSYSTKIWVWQGTISTNSDTFKTNGSNTGAILMAIE